MAPGRRAAVGPSLSRTRPLASETSASGPITTPAATLLRSTPTVRAIPGIHAPRAIRAILLNVTKLLAFAGRAVIATSDLRRAPSNASPCHEPFNCFPSESSPDAALWQLGIRAEAAQGSRCKRAGSR